MISQDVIPAFIPKKTRAVILGTMCSVSARKINGEIQKSPPFYYHDNRNRFWKIMQTLFEGDQNPPFLRLDQKKKYLEKWGIAIANIVSEMEVPKAMAYNASDDVIYRAHKNNKVITKKASKSLQAFLKTKPLFFTCKQKAPLDLLLMDYFTKNKISTKHLDSIVYLHTPTRRGHLSLSEMWKPDFKEHKLI